MWPFKQKAYRPLAFMAAAIEACRAGEMIDCDYKPDRYSNAQFLMNDGRRLSVTFYKRGDTGRVFLDGQELDLGLWDRDKLSKAAFRRVKELKDEERSAAKRLLYKIDCEYAGNSVDKEHP